MVEHKLSYSIETEIPAKYMQELFEYINRRYIEPQKERFMDVSRKMVESKASLSFTLILDRVQRQSLNMEVTGGNPIELGITWVDDTISLEHVNQVKQDIVILVEFFEEKMRSSTLFLAWREGEEIVPEKLSGKEKTSINRIFLETQILLAVVFISFGMLLFFIIGWYAPIVLLGIQLVLVFFSNKLIARGADWHITEDNPNIHLLEYHLPIGEHENFRQKYPRDKLLAIKKEIYEKTLAKKGEVDCNTVQEVFGKHGFACTPENLTTRKVNVYELVKKCKDIFGFPMPEIIVSNTIIPNAAASGPSPNRGIVLITTGLLVQLTENEILSVLGHEFGHLRGRDPLVLFGLTGVEFLFRFYVLFAFFPIIFSTFLFLLYFWAVMTLIFFIAKFFEARADLVSAIVIGEPNVLATALEKIGFKRLMYERSPQYRIQEWVSLDPHPPVYFRINRLEKLDKPVQIKHPLVQSARDVVKGFFASF